MSGFLIFPLLMVVFFVGGEYIMSRKSKWHALSERFKTTGSPASGWTGCRFLFVEITEGNRITRVSYRGRSRFSVSLMEHLFPTAYAGADAKGLYLKRQPWNFMHPPLLIPWTQIAKAEVMNGTDFATDLFRRKMGFSADQVKSVVPGVVGGVLNLVAGQILRLNFSYPPMSVSVPSDALADPRKFLGAKFTA